MYLSFDEQRLVYSTYLRLANAGSGLTDLLYARLFELDPALQDLFKRSLQDLGIKWRMTLNLIVSAADSSSEFERRLGELGHRHSIYGVKVEHYTTFREAVLWAFQTYMGADYTPEVDAVWRKLFQFIEQIAAQQDKGV